MAINYSYSSVNLSGQVTQSLKDVSQYITASAGGWPDYKVGMIAGYDFTIESGSGDVKIYEFIKLWNIYIKNIPVGRKIPNTNIPITKTICNFFKCQ